MESPQYSYDEECETLARYFLSDDKQQWPEDALRDLAQAIQDAAEDWLVFNVWRAAP